MIAIRWCAALIALLTLAAPGRRAEALRHIGSPFDDVTALLTRSVADHQIAGAVAAVAQHGTVSYLQAVGVQELETRAPMTERSLFRIYSMTKPVTAAAVMMLYEAGRGPLAVVEATVLGRLVEIWSGRPLDAFLDERIFAPLGMVDTGFWVRPGQRARLATVYQVGRGRLTPFEIEPEVPFTERPALLEGAVGLVSTVPDFLRFSQMLLNHGELNGVRILTAKTVDRMTRNALPDAVLEARGGRRGWGLGNVDVAMDSGEYGWDGSAGTIFTVDPRHELITILMWQSVPADPDGLRGRIKALVSSGAGL